MNGTVEKPVWAQVNFAPAGEDSEQDLTLGAETFYRGKIEALHAALAEALWQIGVSWREETVEDGTAVILADTYIRQFGVIQIAELHEGLCRVGFYQPGYPDEEEILDRERVLRLDFSRPAYLWLLDNLGWRAKVLEVLGDELYERRCVRLEVVQTRLVGVLGLVYSLPLEAGLVQTSGSKGDGQPQELVRTPSGQRDIPPACAASPALREDDKELLRLWQAGLTARQIGWRTGLTEKTVLNHLTVLRRILGVEHVPRRK